MNERNNSVSLTAPFDVMLLCCALHRHVHVAGRKFRFDNFHTEAWYAYLHALIVLAALLVLGRPLADLVLDDRS